MTGQKYLNEPLRSTGEMNKKSFQRRKIVEIVRKSVVSSEPGLFEVNPYLPHKLISAGKISHIQSIKLIIYTQTKYTGVIKNDSLIK